MELKKGLPDRNGVKVGYKQTEVGVIPKDWDVRHLRPMLKQNPAYGINAAAVPLKGDLPVYIRITDISDEGYFMPSQRVGVDHPLSEKYYLEKGDLVFARTGASVGKSYLYNPDDGKLVYAGFLIKIKPDERVLSPTYLSQYVKTQTYWGWVQIMSMRSGQPGINGNEYSQLLLPLPPTKAEQTAIAAVLSDADALIQSIEKLIAKKRLIKQGAMQELLKPKEGWVVKKLGSLFEITSSKRVFQKEWKAEGIPFYRAREIAVLGETGHINNDLFITRDMYVTFKKTYGVPNIGDMLVTGVGTLGKTYVISDNHEFYFKDGNIIWFKIAGTVCTEFLRQLYLTPFVIKQIANASAGTTVGTYTISGAKRTTIPLPPSLAEQTRIATILADMDAEISALETKLAKYKQVKQGMMQNLLTGKIRLV